MTTRTKALILVEFIPLPWADRRGRMAPAKGVTRIKPVR